MASTTEELFSSIQSFNFKILQSSLKTSNQFLSPLSIYALLIMAMEGAKGETRQELLEILSLENSDDPRAEFQKLLQSVQKLDLIMSTAIWIDENLNVREEYQNLVSQTYKSGIFFFNPRESDQSAAMINQWAADSTNDKIEDLVDPNQVGGSNLIMTNALYFKAKWAKPFSAIDDTPSQFSQIDKSFHFHLDDDTAVPVPAMKNSDPYSFIRDKEKIMVKIPYEGGKMEMLVLMPINQDLDTYLAKSNADLLSQFEENAISFKITLKLPKFSITDSSKFQPILKDMGLQTSTSPSADFSEITNNPQGIFIEDIIQKGFVHVDEWGTEAAVASAMMMTIGGESLEIAIDHPFCFFIRDTQTKTIYFIGIVRDPRH